MDRPHSRYLANKFMNQHNVFGIFLQYRSKFAKQSQIRVFPYILKDEDADGHLPRQSRL